MELSYIGWRVLADSKTFVKPVDHRLGALEVIRFGRHDVWEWEECKEARVEEGKDSIYGQFVQGNILSEP